MKMIKKLAAAALVGALVVGGGLFVGAKIAIEQPPLPVAPYTGVEVSIEQPPLPLRTTVVG